MKETSGSNQGMWQSSICINCQTSELHTENDCTYTVITTPNQKVTSVPYFILELRKGFTLGMEMNPGTTFMFSGKYLFHRQMILDTDSVKAKYFVNFASYGNARLYNHLKSTIKRVYK